MLANIKCVCMYVCVCMCVCVCISHYTLVVLYLQIRDGTTSEEGPVLMQGQKKLWKKCIALGRLVTCTY